MQSKRPAKGHAPPAEFFALGSKPKGGSDTDSKSSSSSTSNPLRKVIHGSSGALPVKREAASLPSAASIVTKKPRLAAQTFTPLGRAAEVDRRASPTTQAYLYDEIAVDVDSHDLLELVEDAIDKVDDDRLEALLCGAVKCLKASRARPDTTLMVSLMLLAKTHPTLFASEVVIEAFCSLLKRDVAISFKAKGNPTVSIMVCNLLMASFQDEENWPDNFIKVYMDDSLGERIWVDRPDCRAFVENIQTAFSTRLPQFSMLASEMSGKVEAGGTSPTHMTPDDEDSLTYEEKFSKREMTSTGADDDVSTLVSPRYTYQLVSIETYVLEMIREHLSRRQPIDGGSRNLVRTMTATCGYAEVRTLAAQRLEMWLQNPKLTRAAQDLLMCVCMNCDQQHFQLDAEVTNLLTKIRLKTKSLVNHYLMCMRELLGQSVENIRRLLVQTVTNELSATRSPNNMMLITVMFQQSPEHTARLLAEIFLDMLMGREDCLRSLRTLLREIVRSVKHDMNFSTFTTALMRDCNDSKFRDLDQMVKERYYLAVIDIMCLSMLLSANATLRDGGSTRADIKEFDALRNFQNQTSFIQRDAVWWLHSVVLKSVVVKQADCIHSLRKVLFVEKAEQYYKLDNWPPENERSMIMRLVSEIPLLDDTLYRVLTMGLTRDLHLSSPDVIDLVDNLVKRAAVLHTEDFPSLKVDRVEIIEILLNLCTYRHPENIALPKGYQPPVLAITSLYWKAWAILLILSAFNPSSFGKKGWYEYPTLRCLMEMTMTNTFKFPPPTTAPDDKTADEIRARELQMTEFIKQQILEFESHLAAATSKQQITEATSLLISQLTRMEPTGIAVRPPTQVLDQLKVLNQSLRIGHALCRSRDPDFLLEIIQQQGTSRSMPWLADLVESNDSSLDVLPVQCLCEFLLHDSPPDVSNHFDDDDVGHFDKHKKQKHHKQEQLLKRLQLLLQSSTADSQPVVNEVLDFFLKRLGSPHGTTRKLAVKGLASVLSKSLLDDADLSPMDVDVNAVLPMLPSHQWLLEHLPSLPLFEVLNMNICAALRLACQVETDAHAVSAYIIFLAQHSAEFDIHDLDGLALDMAQLIVERVTLMNHLLPQEDLSSPLSEFVLASMIGMFYVYLTKAQQPQIEDYQWSESQDQIRLQWPSGKSAVMNILVVHAMIILLTYGKPKETSKFDELLDSWFPENGNPPSAFLVDTSEEALLLPDWLKLRMIRSSVVRLIDAALVDLEPAQLLLFVQSFGIPVISMSRLLHCLDMAVEMDAEAMGGAVVDKGYMAQLIEVQRMRGATGGDRFYELLLDGHSSPSQPERSGLLKLSARRRAASQLFRTPEISAGDVSGIDKMAILLCKIFDISPYEDRQTQFQALLKSVRKPSTASVLIQTLVKLLTSSVAPSVVRGLKHHVELACPLIRLLMLNKEKFVPLADLLASALKGSTSTLVTTIEQYRSKCDAKMDVTCSGSSLQSSSQQLRHILGTAVSSAGRTSSDEIENSINACLANVSDDVQSVVNVIERSITDNTDKMAVQYTGLLVDWLEVLNPNFISDSQSSLDTQLDFLFGSHNKSPDIAGQNEVDKRKCRSSYLLSLLTHQCHWSTVRLAISSLLSSPQCVQRYCPSTVLDFMFACIHLPRLWQGRDKKLPKNYMMEDVLSLSERQITIVVLYILAEAETISSGQGASSHVEKTAAESVELVGSRMELLRACCCNKNHLVNAVVDFLMEKVKDGRDSKGLCHCLLLNMYLWLPYQVTAASEQAIHCGSLQSQSSQIDAVSHRLVSTLGSAAPGKNMEEKMQDANISCRKLASEHPMLILRQLPMLSALLQGRAQFSFNEVRSRNHVQLYTHVLGLIELIQPHIFHPQYSSAFQDVLQAYFELLQFHGFRRNKQLIGVIVKFLQLMHNFLNYDRQLCSSLLHKHLPILNGLSQQFPDNPVLISLLAGLSLPLHDDTTTVETPQSTSGSEARRSDSVPKLPMPFSPYQLVQVAHGMRKGADIKEICSRLQELDEMSKRRVDVLEHFVGSLQWLMLHTSDTCRSPAHSLMMRLVRHDPRCAQRFHETMLQCLEHSNTDIVNSALKNLAEYVVLSQEDALELLQKAFTVCIRNEIESKSYISDAVQMLNLETLVHKQ